MAIKKAACLYRGNSRTIKVVVSQGGVPVDITGDDVIFVLKQDVDVEPPLIEKTNSVHEDPVNGTTYFYLTKDETAALDVGRYYYSITLIQQPGGEVSTLAERLIDIDEPIREPAP